MRLRCESWMALGTMLLLLASSAQAQSSAGDALSKYLDAATQDLAAGNFSAPAATELPTATDVSHLLAPDEPASRTLAQPISYGSEQESYWDQSYTGQSTPVDVSSRRVVTSHSQVHSLSGGCATCNTGSTGCSDCTTCDAGCGDCADYCGCKPFCWYAGVEAMNWRRNTPRNRALVFNQMTGAALLTTEDMDTDGEEGFRLQLGYWITPGQVALEATYFGIHDWESRPATADMGNLVVPLEMVPAFTGFDVAVIDYRSELDSGELNVRCNFRRRPNLSLITGGRYIRVKEEMRLRNLTMAGAETSQYYLFTENELILLQGGLQWDGQIAGKLGLDIRAVGGGGVNLAYQNQQIAGTRNNFDHAAEGVYFGEGVASATYRLGRSVRLRAGYNLLFLGGMALAPEQVNFSALANTNNSEVNANGHLFYHGVSFGLDFFR